MTEMSKRLQVPKRPKEQKKSLGQYYTSTDVCEFMVGLSDVSKDARVLETGCGEGAFIKSLINHNFTDITAYDIHEPNVEYCKAQFGEKANILCQDYLRTSRREKYDLIIGNPPYVQWNNINPEIRKMLREDPFWSQHSNGEWDLLYAFIVWSIEKLREGGELIYIVPYNWFTSTYGASLRDYLVANGRFDVICHFSELKLFKDCFPNNIVFKYTKTDEKDVNILVSEYTDRSGDPSEIIAAITSEFEVAGKGDYENGDITHRVYTMPQFPSGETWYLATPSERVAIEKLEEATGGNLLGDHLDVGVGIVSGYDKAFLLTEEEAAALPEDEGSHVFPFVKARNCERYTIGSSSKFIFVDSVKSEEELRALPSIYNRLSEHREGMDNRYEMKRKGNKKDWWNWATIRNMELFKDNLDKAKIFVPCRDRSLQARYSYTDDRVYGSGDVLMIAAREGLKEDLRYVLAWLNSDMVNDWYFVKGSRSGHRILYTQSYVAKVPLLLIDWDDEAQVSLHNRIVSEVQGILDKRQPQANIEHLLQEIIHGI